MYGATAGQVGILKSEMATNQAVCGILPDERVVPEYLYYILKSLKDKMISNSVGGAQPNISQRIIRNLEIPLPPTEIQEQIVSEIESYQKIIDGAKQVVENYRPTMKVESAWKRVKLGKIFKLSSGRPLVEKDRIAGRYAIYGGNGITGKHILNCSLNICKCKENDQWLKRILKMR